MKFLIIGCGLIGDTHARVLKLLNQELALCDSVKENVDTVGELYGVEERYYDWDTAIANSFADVAVICTPNHLHAAPAIAAMRQGMDILCEKPMAATSDQAKEMLKVVKETGKRMLIAYPLRSGEPLLYVKKVLEEGTLGKVLSARCVLASPETLWDAKSKYRCSYETGGGIIYDYTHELDYLRFLLGEPTEGMCFCDSLLKKDCSVDDTADVLLRFSSGPIAHIHFDYLQERGRGRGRCFELICENGYLSCDFKDVHIAYNDGTDVEEKYENEWDPRYIRQANAFFRFCEGEKVPCATAEDGVRVMEIADALYVSARTRTIVEL